MDKKESELNIDTSKLENEQVKINSDFSDAFVESLVNQFKEGACHYIEAKRFINSNDPKKEVELIANDETPKLKRRQNLFHSNLFK